MTVEESTSLGIVLKKVYRALKVYTDAERIYQLSTMEGQPHLHIWIMPRRKDVTERGLKFLARDDSCNDEEAIELADKLREAMK
jgi:diadenosine tetraphosphate (Ap4A) HIT family hydrolase